MSNAVVATVETISKEYAVRPENLGWLRAQLDRINRRARRLKVAECTLVAGEAIVKHYGTGKFLNGVEIKHARVVVPCTITGQAPVVAGWKFVATLQHEEAGTIVRTVPGTTAEGELNGYRDAGPDCNHCGLDRKRKDTYVVRRTEDGALKQVGRQCVQDYLGGHDPQRMAHLAELLAAIGEAADHAEEEGGYGSPRALAFVLAPFVARCLGVSRADGYRSRTACRAKGLPDELSTASMAWRAEGEQHSQLARDSKPTEAEETEAARILTVADELLEARNGSRDDYEHNLFVSLASGVVTYRSAGLVASVVGYVQRAENKAAEAKVAGATAHHVGTVGARMDGIVTVLGCMVRDGDYGATTLVKLALTDGARLIWWASGAKAFAVGSKHWATFSVKAHETDRQGGYAVTKVTRVDLGEVEAFERQTGRACTRCGALAGEWCKGPKGRVAKLHKVREG